MCGLKRLPALLIVIVFCAVLSVCPTSIAQQVKSQTVWPESILKRVSESKNKEQLQQLLDGSDSEIRTAVQFVIENMPKRDLDSMTAEFLLNDIRLANKIRKDSPWKISDELFLNDVLPYANVDETREPWRKKLNEICAPMIADCKTPGEAAHRINQKMFKEIKVKYSRKRKKANQSPSESMEQGLASCTGLSILLVDACRSVGVPARLAGIPSWPNKRGNHTWVEVWDQGTWHFAGAAEASKNGLNDAWFQKDAALAQKDSKRHAIYAVSFGKTETVFPMVWSRDRQNPVYAVNVTDRYTKDSKSEATEKSAEAIAVFVRVWNADKSERVVKSVQVKNADGWSDDGKSRNNEADMNDMLRFELKKNQTYEIRVGDGKWQPLKTTDEDQQTIDIKTEI